MFSHIFFDQNRIYIRITVFTQMSASIIGTYICPQKTCTFPISLIFLSLWNFQFAMESCLKCMNSHTSGAICTIFCKIFSFCTSLQFFQYLSNIFIHADRFFPYFFRCICFTLVQTYIKCMLKCVCHLPERIFYNTRGLFPNFGHH